MVCQTACTWKAKLSPPENWSFFIFSCPISLILFLYDAITERADW